MFQQCSPLYNIFKCTLYLSSCFVLSGHAQVQYTCQELHPIQSCENHTSMLQLPRVTMSRLPGANDISDADHQMYESAWPRATSSFNETPRVVFMHIPKTAGSSFKRDLAGNLGLHMPKDSERCFGMLYQSVSHTVHVTFLRSPRSHVLSQYLECRFARWGLTQTNGTAFPRSSDNFYLDFAAWLRIYASGRELGTEGSQAAFNCYNPINMMTRQLSCSRPETPHWILPDPWKTSAETALEHMSKLEVVGITELYAESLCLALYKITKVLPAECHQEGDKCVKPNMHKITHDLPEHNVAMASEEAINDLDSITQMDSEVYRAGVRRFLYEIKQIEKQTNTTILCQKRRTEFFQSIIYLGNWSVDLV